MIACTSTQWVSSIKTRIKTQVAPVPIINAGLLNEYLPLKQGLRRIRNSAERNAKWLNEYLPLKQGLRLHHVLWEPRTLTSQWVSSIKTRIKTCQGVYSLSTCRQLNEYLPLKQGLRHEKKRASRDFSPLNEYLPLKQGLRRSC